MMEQISQYPLSILIFVGILVLSNIGVIITILTFIFKAGMFVSETRKGIETATKQASGAHERLNALEGKRR